MLDFLYTAVSWVLLRWHDLISVLGLDPAGGVNWTLSIALLVVTARLVLLPVTARHFADRHKPPAERSALAGCLPVLLSVPIFIAVLHVLRHLSNAAAMCSSGDTGRLVSLYSFTPTQTCNGGQARLFGAPLAGVLRESVTGASLLVTIVVVALSASAIVLTQVLTSARETTVPTGPAASVQKTMRVLAPGSVLLSAAFLPLGVLLYLTTSNVCAALQQWYFHR